ncbi:hypothetical protein SEA_JONJAMES_188 [Gordonia Phage JonJames]|nr:hypothetical protein SEA_JONJAMES_188 [Gordonia Phage JonJames]
MYKYLAAQQAFDLYGKQYADYTEQHIDELLDKGIDVTQDSLSERLAGNDGL